MVLYGDTRGQYLGTDLEGRIKIKTIVKTECLNYVPVSMSYKIKPYNGSAKTLDGRGIRKGSLLRNKFLVSLFDMQQSDK